MYRNPVGHTFMGPDANQGKVARLGNSVEQVVSTEHWSRLAASGGFDSLVMEQKDFYQFKKYLLQMYVPRLTDVTGASYSILDYRWANFGWGKLPSGQVVHHPREVWLRSCDGDAEDEWYKEEPVRVCFARDCAPDGVPYEKSTFDITWINELNEENYGSYNGPLALTLEKQHDLYSLRPMLAATDEFDDAYLDAEWPEPAEALPVDEDAEASD